MPAPTIPPSSSPPPSPPSPPPSSSRRASSRPSTNPSSSQVGASPHSDHVDLNAHNTKIFKAYGEENGAGVEKLEHVKVSADVDDWKKAVDAHEPDLHLLTDILKTYVARAKDLNYKKLCLFSEDGVVVLERPRRKSDAIKIFYDPVNVGRARTETYPAVNQDLTKLILNCLHKQDVISRSVGRTPGSAGNGHTEEDQEGRISPNGPPPEPPCDYDDADTDLDSVSIRSGSQSLPGIIHDPDMPELNGPTDSPSEEEGILLFNLTLSDTNKTSREDAERIALLEQRRQSVERHQTVQHHTIEESLPLEGFRQPGPLEQTYSQASNEPVYKKPQTASPVQDLRNVFFPQDVLSAPSAQELLEITRDGIVFRMADKGPTFEEVLDKERRSVKTIDDKISQSDSYSSACKAEMVQLTRAQSITYDFLESMLSSSEGKSPILMKQQQDRYEEKPLKTMVELNRELMKIAKRHAELPAQIPLKRHKDGRMDMDSIIGKFETANRPEKATEVKSLL